METYTFFDTETSKLPLRNARWSDPDQPYVIQLAAITTDAEGNEMNSFSTLLQCPVESDEGAYNTHKIGKDLTDVFGLPQAVALSTVGSMFHMSDHRVAHNAQFDDLLLKIASTKIKYWALVDLLKESKPICTADLSTPVLNLPPTAKMVRAGFNKPKRPKLEECYQHFFGESLEGAHDALIDVRACARVYFHMKKEGLING